VFSRFFIDRPIFASVLSIVITLGGAVSVGTLPLAQYPPITPPTIQVMCTYPGADARVLAQTVAAPIEQQINGVENMLYMSSQCTNDGSYNLTVTFKPGVNLNFAQVLVQNRVNLALPQLPDVVKAVGVTTRKRSPDILLIATLFSPDNSRDNLYLSNYALIQIRDELARVEGVGDVFLFGSMDYSMRIWVSPDMLSYRDMTAGDVIKALRDQNIQVAAGQLGQQPMEPGQAFQYPLRVLGRLSEPEQFAEVVIKNLPDGRVVRVKDIGRVELGAKSLDIIANIDGKPSVNVAVFQLPDSNALDTADRVRAKMEELKENFPPGVDYIAAFDTTPFIRESVNEVFKTLRDAIILVAIVVLLFLQNWRSALIPLVAVPVAIVGTFAAMAAIGFSLNNLTLFGMVLAIGIVVDDAIVVVEAVEHHIEEGMTPRDATIRAMHEVSGPVVAVALVLSAVFVPCAFISGITGQFFRQFALTIAVSTIISAFNSLTLSPALAALLLKPRNNGNNHAPLPRLAFLAAGGWLGWEFLGPLAAPAVEWLHGALPEGYQPDPILVAQGLGALAGALAGWLLSNIFNYLLGRFFWIFNVCFRWATRVYMRLVSSTLLGHVPIPLLLFALAGACLGWCLPAIINWLDSGIHTHWLKCNLDLTLNVTPFVPPILLDRSWLFSLTRVLVGLAAGGVLGLLALLSFRPVTGMHSRPTGEALRGSVVVLLAYGGMLLLTWRGFTDLPTGYIPTQDKGYLLISVQLPDASSLERTRALVVAGDKIVRTTPGVAHSVAISGQSFVLGAFGSNFGQFFIILDEFHKRGNPEHYREEIEQHLGRPLEPGELDSQYMYSERIAERLRKEIEKEVPGAQFNIFGPPPVQGLGTAGGFKFLVEDRGDLGLEKLQTETMKLIDTANAQPGLTGVFTIFRADSPQLFVDVNRDQVATSGVLLGDVFTTLQVYLGSQYVNDFNRFGRTWQVNVQAEGKYRNEVEDVRSLKVRSNVGKMVPLGTVTKISEINGPILLTRYNMYPAAAVNGNTAPGFSSGQGIDIMEKLAKTELPSDMALEWTEITYIQLIAGNTALVLFVLAVVLVFLVLAAQYESWSLPLAVILVVPMCVLSALTGVAIAKDDINIFTQIGFVVLVGLASKNAILIVEFAKHKREQGLSSSQATLEACKLRLRPILMTSFAFVLGVVPLLLTTGAGAEMRRTLGNAVFSGMLGVTLFGIFLTPVFFFVIDQLGSTKTFSSPIVQRIGDLTLGLLIYGVFGVLTGGILWAFLLYRRVRRAPLFPLGAPVERLRTAKRNGPAAPPSGIAEAIQVPVGDGKPAPPREAKVVKPQTGDEPRPDGPK
jgi:multidrug efflux pump subunit AcrB